MFNLAEVEFYSRPVSANGGERKETVVKIKVYFVIFYKYTENVDRVCPSGAEVATSRKEIGYKIKDHRVHFVQLASQSVN